MTFYVSYALIMVQFLMTFKSDLSNHSSKDEESLLLLVDSDDNGNLKKKEFKHVSQFEALIQHFGCVLYIFFWNGWGGWIRALRPVFLHLLG